MHNLTKQNPIVAAITATAITALLAMASYLLLEPTSLFAQTDTNTFTITQTIGSEISFAVTENDLTMSSTIGGATGGSATTSATVAVTTNSSSGYTLAIKFSNATAMTHTNGSDTITNYASTSPDYNMNIGAGSSGFAYSVSSTNSIGQFVNDGAACTTGAIRSIDNCYSMHASPNADFTIVNSSAPATSEETKIGFQVIVAAGSGLINGNYIATTTLTATVQ